MMCSSGAEGGDRRPRALLERALHHDLHQRSDVVEAFAHGLAHQRTRVDAFENDGELVRRPASRRSRAGSRRGPIVSRTARPRRRAAGIRLRVRSSRRRFRSAHRRGRSTGDTARGRRADRRASPSPSRAPRRSGPGSSGCEHRVVEAVVAVHDRGRRRVGERGAQPAGELVDRRASRGSSSAPTARPSAAPGARRSRRDDRIRRGRPRRSRPRGSRRVRRRGFRAAAGSDRCDSCCDLGAGAQDHAVDSAPSRRTARRSRLGRRRTRAVAGTGTAVRASAASTVYSRAMSCAVGST